MQAIQAATIQPAAYFNLEDQYGKIAQGYTADILILSHNPLDDIRHTRDINHVIFNGAHYDTQAIEQLKNHVKERARSFSVACKIIWRFIKNPANY